MSYIDQIADAVVAKLNAAVAANTLSPPFTAQRVYLSLVNLEAADELTVLVVPKSDTLTPSSRDRSSEDIEIDVGIIQHLQPDAEPTAAGPSSFTTAMDKLLRLCQDIALLYRGGDTAGQAAFMKATFEPIYDPTYLQESRTFRARITMTFYQALRTI